tara:strand:+ start:305 stop:748 length:444 start_codon:yes stop_codon:yes gene_type:complete
MSLKIERMNPGPWGKVKAFFDVVSSDGFTMKGFKLVDGINGLFVSVPSRQGTDDQGNTKYYDNIWIESKDLRQNLHDVVIEAYNQKMNESSQGMDAQYEPNHSQSSDNTGSNLTPDNPVAQNSSDSSNTAQSNTDNVKSFSDDDVPF